MEREMGFTPGTGLWAPADCTPGGNIAAGPDRLLHASRAIDGSLLKEILRQAGIKLEEWRNVSD
jgi:hypothetical protein